MHKHKHKHHAREQLSAYAGGYFGGYGLLSAGQFYTAQAPNGAGTVTQATPPPDVAADPGVGAAP